MSANFTPGPWTSPIFHGTPEDNALAIEHGLTPVPAVDNNGARFVMTAPDEHGDRKRIGLVDCQTGFKRGQGHQTACEERDANARLIAAAPELYAALAALVADVTDADHAPHDWSEQVCIREARAVLAIVCGRTYEAAEGRSASAKPDDKESGAT